MSNALPRCLRVTLVRADQSYLYVTPAEASPADAPLRISLAHLQTRFADTVSLLWPGARLNLLDVQTDATGTLLPALLILEPDYLLDISSLAECFKPHGHSPLNYLLAQLQPSENTAAMLLGNIANLFLDEWIYAPQAPDYLACMQRAFRTYPLELAACADLHDAVKERAFFADCKRHFEHIGRIVTQTFPAISSLRREDAVLEPSYLCEPLGLQGRLDYMQRDGAALIEMKSGKADEYTHPGQVEPRENHHMQMLLYQAVLHYVVQRPLDRVKTYLLYTRYPLLYPADWSWPAVQEALNLRNRIVAVEHALWLHNSPDYTARVLRAIQPARLNERRLTTTLWKRWTAPAIEAFTDSLAALTPLEQHYFYALHTFITTESYLAKTGALTDETHAGAASHWLCSLEEKCEAGEILYDLQLEENHATDPTAPTLRLRISRPPVTLPNFRPGDAVVLYPRDSDADRPTNQLIFKATIAQLSACSVLLRLRAAQQNSAVLSTQSRYALEHDFMDTAYRSMYRGLSNFLTATPERRDLLLGVRPPRFEPLPPSDHNPAPDDIERIIRRAQAARDYFLLVGPPGTGKTSRALRGMVAAFCAQGKQMLLLSYTNRAVDEICKAIPEGIDYIRLGSELSCDEAFRPHLLANVLSACTTRRAVEARLAGCSVFVGTIATLSLRTELFRLKKFDVAIVDEATQVLEPQLLGLLCERDEKGGNAIDRFILIGDYKQLPAVVLQTAEQSAVHEEALHRIGLYNLRDSLFERLYRQAATYPLSVDMLRRQGRMNAEVARFPNQAFYDGQLLPVGLPHQAGTLSLQPELRQSEFADILTRRVAFLPSRAEPPGRSFKINHSEAQLAARLAAALYRQYREGFDAARTLGIITPYRSQIALIRHELAQTGIEALGRITVDTVERFQGSEREVILYSCCVNRAEQFRLLANLTQENGALIDRKLNVVLTRARCQFFLLGVPEVLHQNEVYASLLESLIRHTSPQSPPDSSEQ
ncbi:MAG: AAA family ATPase [Prevotellaceae bacterium]|jgi:hypothetical protein|nr:AAA family ATPase [Prevotellaceae bacterium]